MVARVELEVGCKRASLIGSNQARLEINLEESKLGLFITILSSSQAKFQIVTNISLNEWLKISRSS